MPEMRSKMAKVRQMASGWILAKKRKSILKKKPESRPKKWKKLKIARNYWEICKESWNLEIENGLGPNWNESATKMIWKDWPKLKMKREKWNFSYYKNWKRRKMKNSEFTKFSKGWFEMRKGLVKRGIFRKIRMNRAIKTPKKGVEND